MTTNEENIIDDGTYLEVNESNNEQEETENEMVSENVTEQKQEGKSRVKNAMIGGASIAAGIGSAMTLMGFKEPEEPVANPDTDEPPIPEPPYFEGAEVSVSHGVNDNMTFSQAFAAARREVGSGGVFQWHGHVYSTYYTEEWEDFSDEYKQAFSNFHYPIKPEQQHDDILQDAMPHYGETPANTISQPDDWADTQVTAGIEGAVTLPVGDTFIEIDSQEEVAVVLTAADEQSLVSVDSDLDSSYDIAVIGNTGDSENPPVYGYDNDDIISYDSSNYDADHLADFQNDADISNFV